LIRAAASFAITGDKAGLQQLKAEHTPKLQDNNVEILIDAFASEEFEDHAGDFLMAYEAYLES
jgi:hypothetical protein